MCLPCMLAKKANRTYKKKTLNKLPCKYTLQELLDLNETVTNSYLTSQINIYSKDCNRYNSQIDELI